MSKDQCQKDQRQVKNKEIRPVPIERCQKDHRHKKQMKTTKRNRNIETSKHRNIETLKCCCCERRYVGVHKIKAHTNKMFLEQDKEHAKWIKQSSGSNNKIKKKNENENEYIPSDASVPVTNADKDEDASVQVTRTQKKKNNKNVNKWSTS
jgi:hypothetical protein